MADSDAQPETEQQPHTEQVTSAAATKQVTSPAPATKPKNPKRVAAGKLVAQKTKMAREAQKKGPLKLLSLLQTARQNSRSPHRRQLLNPHPRL